MPRIICSICEWQSSKAAKQQTSTLPLLALPAVRLDQCATGKIMISAMSRLPAIYSSINRPHPTYMLPLVRCFASNARYSNSFVRCREGYCGAGQGGRHRIGGTSSPLSICVGQCVTMLVERREGRWAACATAPAFAANCEQVPALSSP